MSKTVRSFLALSIFPLVVSAGQAAVSVHDDFVSPRFIVPAATEAPKIDGNTDAPAWQHALCVDALQTTEGNLSSRPTQWMLCWDADNLYVGMKSPLRPGERLGKSQRVVGRDNVKTVFDDAYEIFINAHTRSPDSEPVFFQYLGNVAGAKYDVMFEPFVGNSRPGWESGWKPVNRVTSDGKYWEMTVAIPRKSLYRDTPFADGDELGGLFVRDFKRPWEQNNLGGSGSFSAPDSHCKLILSETAPAIRFTNTADAARNTFGDFDVQAYSPTKQTLRWSMTDDSGSKSSGTIPAEPDPGIGHFGIVDHPGTGYYRIKVTSDDGKTTYLDWSSKRAFGDKSALTQDVHDTGKTATLELTFNPVANFVRVAGDFINYDDRGSIKKFTASIVDGGGKPIVEQPMAMDELSYVNGLLKLGDIPAGSYVTRLIGFDTNDKEIFRKETPFEKKDLAKEYPWWNTTVGRIDRVIAPWTPVKVDGPRVDVWGREMVVGIAGLPTQITSQGTDLLAGSSSLSGETSDGQKIVATAGTTTNDSAADYRVVMSTTGQLGDGIDVTSRVTTEFDGLYKVQMTLTPKRATSLRQLKVSVPISPRFADYCHACGEGIRYGFSYGYLPKDKTGALWTSKQVDGQPMLVGSFIPYVWLGNDRAGLCFMADNDEGWAPNDAVPAIEIRRDDPSHVDLVLNLISSSTTIDTPRTITFALEATPVKPAAPGWRMNTWCTADSFQDFCKVEPGGGQLIWNALPFTLDAKASKKMMDERHRSTMDYEWGVKDPKYHANAVPYFENNGIDQKLAPAAGYFADEWHARVSDSTAFCKSYNDFIVYNLDQFTKQTGMDGWYVDNVRPVACDNIDAGRGYRLRDGRLQPTYQMFATREQFLRVRAMFQDNGKTGKFVLHMTNHMIMPWIGAADLALDGEDHVTFPDMHKDFIDFWSLPRLRLDDQQCQGTPVTFLQEFQGNWTTPDLERVMRSYTAMTILNDVLPGANPNGRNNAVWAGRYRFGIDADDVTFVPYWTKGNGVAVDGDGLYASSWRRPGGVMIAVVNTGASDVTANLKLDAAKLGVSEADLQHAIDADTGEALPLAVPVKRHDYRQVMIGTPRN